MQINSPSLVLVFPDNTTETTTSIQKDSIQIQDVFVERELKASSDLCQLALVPDSTSIIDDILSEDGSIKATLKDGNTPLFTGYLSSSFSWAINTTGEDVLKLTIEDIGSHLLQKPFTDDDSSFIKSSFSTLVHDINEKCGNQFVIIYDSSVSPEIRNTELVNKIDSSKTCQEILDEVCFELGLAYDFDASGNLNIKKINITDLADYTLSSKGTGDLLYTDGGSAIDFTRQARQYRQVRVKYSSIEDSVNPVPIYKVEGNIEVPAGQWWDGQIQTDPIYSLTMDEFFQANKTYYILSGSTWVVATVTVGDPVPDNTYYEYSGSAGLATMTDIDKGKDILYVYSNTLKPGLANQNTAYSDGGIDYVAAPTGFSSSSWTLKQYNDTDNLNVLIDNTLSSTSVIYTAFQAYAHIIRKSGNGSVFRAADGLSSGSDAQYTYEATWIHEKSLAANLATLLDDWYRFCDRQYVFRTVKDMPIGSIVSINENMFTNETYTVLITSKEYYLHSDYTGLFKYTCRMISEGLRTQKTITGGTEAQVPAPYVPDIDVDVNTFTIATSVSTIKMDLRASTSQLFRVYAQVQGDPGPLTVTAETYENLSLPVTVITQNREWEVSVPYNTTTSSVKVTMVGQETKTASLSVEDVTEYGYNFGLLSLAPSNPLYVSGKPLDWYTDETDGLTYEWNGSSWIPSDSANRLTQGLTELISAGIDLSTISNSNTVSFFRTLITQEIYTSAIKAVQGFFDSITVTGNSFFNGTIKSSAFSTTLRNDTPSSTTTLSLGSTAYWNWDKFKAVLKSNYSTGYTSVSGTYSEIRVANGSSRIQLPYGRSSGGTTELWPNTRSASTYAFPRSQKVYVEIYVPYNSGQAAGLMAVTLKVNGTAIGGVNIGPGNTGTFSTIVNITKGASMTIEATASSSAGSWAALLTYYDVPGDFPDVCFFNSSGAVQTYSGTYQTGSLTVGSYSPSPILYKWAGMSSASGGGEVTSNSRVSLVNEDGSISISNKQIVYVSWTNTSQLRLVFSDNTSVTLDASLYYRSLSGSFSLLTASDSVESATITPKASTNTVGAAGNPFNEGHFNNLYGALTGNVTGNLTGNLTGNVNSSSTAGTYNVYGAVFN